MFRLNRESTTWNKIGISPFVESDGSDLIIEEPIPMVHGVMLNDMDLSTLFLTPFPTEPDELNNKRIRVYFSKYV